MDHCTYLSLPKIRLIRMSPDLSPITIPSLFAGLASLALGIYVLKKNYHDKASRLFFLLMAACGIWSLGEFTMQLTRNITFGKLSGVFSNLGFIFIPVALLHFSIVYAQRTRRESKSTKTAVKSSPKMYLLYVAPLIMALLLISTNWFFTIRLVVPSDTLIDGNGGWLEYEPLFGPGSDENITSYYFRDFDGDGNFSISLDGNHAESLKYQDAVNTIVLVNTTYSNFTGSNGSITNKNDSGKEIDWSGLENASNFQMIFLLRHKGRGTNSDVIFTRFYLDNGNEQVDLSPWNEGGADELIYKNKEDTIKLASASKGKMEEYKNHKDYHYKALYKSDSINFWDYRDLDGNGKFSFCKNGTRPEPIRYRTNISSTILYNITVSRFKGLNCSSTSQDEYIENNTDENITWISLKNASNFKKIYWLDNDGNEESGYVEGEDVYLDNGNGEWDPLDAPWVKGNVKFQNFVYEQGGLYLVIILFFFFYIIAALGYFFKEYLIRRDRHFRKQIKFMIIGLLMIILFILAEGPINVIIPIIIWDSFITLLISAFFAIAVLKYKLMDVQLIIKKSLTYSIIVLMIAMLFTVVGESLEFLTGKLLPTVSELLSNIIAALIVSISFMPMIDYTKRLFNKMFPKLAKYEKEYVERLSAYESTLEAMWADREITETEGRALEVLRSKLNITKKEHDDILKKQGIKT